MVTRGLLWTFDMERQDGGTREGTIKKLEMEIGRRATATKRWKQTAKSEGGSVEHAVKDSHEETKSEITEDTAARGDSGRGGASSRVPTGTERENPT